MHLAVHTSSPTCVSQHRWPLPAGQQRGLRQRPGPAPHPRRKKWAGAGTTADGPEPAECGWIAGHGERAATYPNVFGSSTIFIFPAEAKRPARREQFGRGGWTKPPARPLAPRPPHSPSAALRAASSNRAAIASSAGSGSARAAGRCLRRARPWSTAGAGAGAGFAASRLSRWKRRPR